MCEKLPKSCYEPKALVETACGNCSRICGDWCWVHPFRTRIHKFLVELFQTLFQNRKIQISYQSVTLVSRGKVVEGSLIGVQRESYAIIAGLLDFSMPPELCKGNHCTEVSMAHSSYKIICIPIGGRGTTKPVWVMVAVASNFAFNLYPLREVIQKVRLFLYSS